MNQRIRELEKQATGNYTQNFNREYLLQIDKDIFEMKAFWLTCADCSMTEPMQPCEACPNRSAQGM